MIIVLTAKVNDDFMAVRSEAPIYLPAAICYF